MSLGFCHAGAAFNAHDEKRLFLIIGCFAAKRKEWNGGKWVIIIFNVNFLCRERCCDAAARPHNLAFERVGGVEKEGYRFASLVMKCERISAAGKICPGPYRSSHALKRKIQVVNHELHGLRSPVEGKG